MEHIELLLHYGSACVRDLSTFFTNLKFIELRFESSLKVQVYVLHTVLHTGPSGYRTEFNPKNDGWSSYTWLVHSVSTFYLDPSTVSSTLA